MVFFVSDAKIVVVTPLDELDLPELDILSPEFLRDPHSHYSKALEQAPVHIEALAGMDRVVRHLVAGAESAIFQGDWGQARAFASFSRL